VNEDAIRLLLSVVVGAMAVDVANKTIARIHPPSCFSMHELVGGLEREISPIGFAIRHAIPFVVGVLVGLLNPGISAVAGAGAAALGALLIVWPPIMHKHLLPVPALARPNEVRFIYALFVCASLLLGLAGGALGGLIFSELAPGAVGRWFAEGSLPPWVQLLMWTLGGSTGSALLEFVRRRIRRLGR